MLKDSIDSPPPPPPQPLVFPITKKINQPKLLGELRDQLGVTGSIGDSDFLALGIPDGVSAEQIQAVIDAHDSTPIPVVPSNTIGDIQTNIFENSRSILINIGEITSDMTQNHIGIVSDMIFNPTSDISRNIMGNIGRAEITAGNPNNMSGGSLTGISGDAIYPGVSKNGSFAVIGVAGSARNDNVGVIDFALGGSATVDNNQNGFIGKAAGFHGAVENHSSGSIKQAAGLLGTVINSGSGEISKASSILAVSPENSGGGNVSDVVGCRVEDHSGIGIDRSDNFYSEGFNSTNVFEGTVETFEGLILRSPNNSRWKIVIGDNGVLSTTPLPFDPSPSPAPAPPSLPQPPPPRPPDQPSQPNDINTLVQANDSVLRLKTNDSVQSNLNLLQ